MASLDEKATLSRHQMSRDVEKRQSQDVMKPFRRADRVLKGPVRQKQVSLSGAVRGLILMIVVIPGIFLLVRNLSGYIFSPDFIIFPDIGHLGTVMLLSLIHI